MKGFSSFMGQIPLAGQVRLAGSAKRVTDTTFSEILSAPAAVVDFWSPSCGPCMEFKPIFEDVAGQSDILMATANVGEAQGSASSYRIQSIPTTIFFANGQEIHRVEGGMSRGDLVSEISRAFGGFSGQNIPAAAPSGGIPTWVYVGAGLAAVGAGVYLATRK